VQFYLEKLVTALNLSLLGTLTLIFGVLKCWFWPVSEIAKHRTYGVLPWNIAKKRNNAAGNKQMKKSCFWHSR